MSHSAKDSIYQTGEINKEVLVFLHYFGGSALSWQWVTEKLSDNYRCLAIHLPGFGGTPALQQLTLQAFAGFVLSVLAQAAVETYTLIGHSMGGKIVLQVAADAPAGAVKGVILVAPSPPTVERMPAEEKERMLHHPSRREAEITVEKVTRLPMTEKQNELAIETQLLIDPATWRWWLLEGMDHSIAAQVKPLNIPVTVLASAEDPAIPYNEIKSEVMEVLPQATLNTLQQAGHLIPMEAPDWVAAQIHKAVSKLPLHLP